MYRLVRRIRAKIKIHEFTILSVTLALALIFGGSVGRWYVYAGRDTKLIASVNTAGGYSYTELPNADSEPEGDAGAAGKRNGINLFAVRDGADNSGFFTSPRAGLLQSANGVSASYLAMDGEALTGTAGDSAGETSDIAGISGDWPGAAEDQPNAAGEPPDAFSEQSGAAGEQSGAAGDSAGMNDTDAAENPIAASDQPIYTVKVIYNGERNVFQTVSKRVSDLFDEKGIAVTELDKVSGAYLDGIIDSDLYIEIKRIAQKTVVEEIKIPAKTVYRYNAEIANGKSKVVRSDADGLKRVEYAISYENGVQVGKKVIKEEIIREAVSGIVEQGSSGTRKGKNGVDFSYKQVIDVKCTAYNLSYESTGKRPGDPAYGITKSGLPAGKGVVAVDPSVIPLGTKMYIEILDDSIEDYGICVAGDTGGKIKGKKVDLFFDASKEELLQFGVRKAKVYILN